MPEMRFPSGSRVAWCRRVACPGQVCSVENAVYFGTVIDSREGAWVAVLWDGDEEAIERAVHWKAVERGWLAPASQMVLPGFPGGEW